jgi:type 1 fimbria pilin
MKLFKYSLLLLSLFLANGVFAQTGCEIEKVATTKIDKTDIEEERVTLTIDTKNCDNEKLRIKLKSVKGGASYTQTDNRIDGLPGYITPQSNQIQLNLDSEESICGAFTSTWGWQCVAVIEIENFTTQEKLFSGFNDPSLTKELIKSALDDDGKYLQYLTKGIILGNCDSSCGLGDAFENDGDNWDFVEAIKGTHTTITSSNCNIKDGDIVWSNYTTQRPVSEQSPQLTINTEDCTGVRLEIDIREDDENVDDDIEIKAGNQTTDSFSVLVNKDTTTLKFKSTNAECDIGGLTPSCRIYVDISYANKDFSTEQYLNQYTSSYKEDISFLSRGVILGYPEISGEHSWWELLSNQLPSVKIINTGYWVLLNTDVLENEVRNNNPQNYGTTKPTYDPDSPCLKKKNNPQEGYSDNCYEFLAPIPGFESNIIDKDGKIISSNVTTTKDGRVAITNLSGFELGDYIQSIFNIALGLLMVLSVVMIVFAGVEYMTVESIYGKSNAKGRITGAVTGLILALGIFLILETINPQLLEINFGKGIDSVSIDIKSDPQQQSFIEGINISGVIAPPLPEILAYEPLIGYLYHQQGPGVAPSSLWAAKKGYARVPNTTPFMSDSSSVQKNVDAQYGRYMSPKDFVERFYKVLKVKEGKINTISPTANAAAVEQAAADVGVDKDVLKTICMIESYDCSKAEVVNSYGYTGLFQFHPERTWPEWKKDNSSVITKPYDNAYAGAKFLESNLSKYQSDKNKMN